MAALFLTNGTRVTRAAFPSTAVTGRNVIHSLNVDVFERKPAANDPRMDDSPLGGQVFKLFARAGTLMTVGQIDDLWLNDVATFTSITPATGGNGGTAVVIVGTNLDGVSGVTIGGVAATSVVVTSRNRITAVTGAHAPGAVDVILLDDAGNSVPATAGGAGAYTYTA